MIEGLELSRGRQGDLLVHVIELTRGKPSVHVQISNSTGHKPASSGSDSLAYGLGKLPKSEVITVRLERGGI
jgi:hypothetical protein